METKNSKFIFCLELSSPISLMCLQFRVEMEKVRKTARRAADGCVHVNTLVPSADGEGCARRES